MYEHRPLFEGMILYAILIQYRTTYMERGERGVHNRYVVKSALYLYSSVIHLDFS